MVERARRGDRKCVDELVERHVELAWRLATAVTRRVEDATAALAAAFARTLAPPVRGEVVSVAPYRAQLLQAVRHAAVDLPPEPTASDADVAPVVAIGELEQLPERLRSALWVGLVDPLPAEEAAVVLDVDPSTGAELVERARTGLLELRSRAQLQQASGRDCLYATRNLTAYANDTLATRQATRIRRHLDQCEECRARLEALDDATALLRIAIPPVPAAVVPGALAAWEEVHRRAAGPLRIVLPSGRAVPAWAQRSVAGAAAAAIALGITSAVLQGAKRGPRDDSSAERARTEQPFGSADGESALGGEEDLPLDDGIPPLSPPLTGDEPAAPAATTSSPPADAPRVLSGGIEPSSPAPSTGSPAPAPSPSPQPGPAQTPPPPATDESEDSAVGIDGVVEIGVGDCTTVELLGVVLLDCAAAGDSAADLDSGSPAPSLP